MKWPGIGHKLSNFICSLSLKQIFIVLKLLSFSHCSINATGPNKKCKKCAWRYFILYEFVKKKPNKLECEDVVIKLPYKPNDIPVLAIEPVLQMSSFLSLWKEVSNMALYQRYLVNVTEIRNLVTMGSLLGFTPRTLDWKKCRVCKKGIF